MKKNHSYILIIVTFLLVSLTVSVSWFRDIESRRIEGERFLFPELGVPTDDNALKMLNDITEVRIESPKEIFSIIKNKESWILPDLANFPVSIDKIKRVIVGLAQLETIEAKTQNPELHGELDLNLPSSDSSPSTSISLIGNENNILATLLVGKDSKSGKDTRYVRRPDAQQTWLAWRNFELPNTKIGWLDEDLFSIGRWRLADIKISHTNDSEVFIARENYAEQYFKIQNLDEGVLPLNPYIGNQIGSSIEKLPIKNIMLKENIHKKDTIVSEYTTFDGLKITIESFIFKDEIWISLHASSDTNLRRELPADGPNIIGLPEMPSFESVVEETQALNEKFSSWVFQFPKSKHVQFRTKLKDIIKIQDLEE